MMDIVRNELTQLKDRVKDLEEKVEKLERSEYNKSHVAWETFSRCKSSANWKAFLKSKAVR